MSGTSPAGTGIHATALVVREFGVLITGESGSGKSGLALALLALAKRAGQFGALVGDDRVWVEAVHGRLVAAGAPQTAGLIERRGVGLVSAPSEPAAVIDLCVALSGPNRRWPRWPEEQATVVAGIAVPRLALDSAAAATDNALAVEERLDMIAADRAKEAGISLEQSAAVHKNKRLRFCGQGS